MKRILLVAACLAVMALASAAQDNKPTTVRSTSEVADQHFIDPPWAERKIMAAASRSQVRPVPPTPTTVAPVPPAPSPAAPSRQAAPAPARAVSTHVVTVAARRVTGGNASGALACIVQHESRGNYGAVNPNGHYGAYQFSPSTWASVGGSGNPANASPAEQDMRARMLLARSGYGQWSTHGMCGV